MLCSWAGCFTLKVPFPTQEYNLWDWSFAREIWVNIGWVGGGGTNSTGLAAHSHEELLDAMEKIVLGVALLQNILSCFAVLSSFS